MKQILLHPIALIMAVVALVLGSFTYAVAANDAPAATTTCIKPTANNPTVKQSIDYNACRFDEVQKALPPVPTVTVTITATATETITASSSPSVTPTTTPTPTATPTVVPGSCAASSANVPDGSDGRGGCFPGVSNTGPNAPSSIMSTYSGSCTITTPNLVIDSQVVNCRVLDVKASGFVLKNSYLNGGIVQSNGAPSFTVQDSLVDSGVQYPACSDGSCLPGKYACGDPNNATTDCGVTGSNFTILRTEIVNSNRAAYCISTCTIADSYFHGTNLWPDRSNLAHASSVREEQYLTLRHNSLHCSYEGPFVNGDIGCSADLTGYPDFAPIHDNTVDGNLFVATPGGAYCAYGGSTPGKPYSNNAANGTNQKFTNNVFQRGANRKCGEYAPIDAFLKPPNNTLPAGNVWSGNVWDSGEVVPAA